MLVVSIIATVITAGSLILAIFVSVRSRQLSQPAITLEPGILQSSCEVVRRREKKKMRVTGLVYGASDENAMEMFVVPSYVIRNNTSVSLENLMVQLNYPSHYAVEDYTFLEKARGKDFVIGSTQVLERAVQLIGRVAQVSYKIPIIRPGEGYVIGDILHFGNPEAPLDHTSPQLFGEGQPLYDRLRGVGELIHFLPIDIFISAANSRPVSQRLDVLWLGIREPDQIESVMQKALDAIWGGKRPEPGIYWQPWGKKTFRVELWHVTIPHFDDIVLSSGRHVRLENVFKSTCGFFVATMPVGDYYISTPRDISYRRVRGASLQG